MTEIIVTGRGSVSTAPDNATITFTTRWSDPSHRAAAEDAAEVAATVLARLAELEVTDRGASHASTRRAQDRDVWDASISVRCRVPAGDAFEVIEQVRAAWPMTVHGPWFEVAADNPARSEARRLAFADARAVAEDYASAAGLVLGRLGSVTDGSGQQRSGDVLFGGTGEAVGLEPAPQDVRAAVTLVFATHQGDDGSGGGLAAVPGEEFSGRKPRRP